MLEIIYLNGEEKMIGKKLKYLIKSTKRKQIDLANYLGISPSRLSNYLSDKREPDFEMLAQMAWYLGVDLNYFSDKDFSKRNYAETNSNEPLMVADTESPYGNETKDRILRVSFLPMNAKKRGINSTTLPVSGIFFADVEMPEKNGIIFQVNGSTPSNIANENDYLICSKCSITELENGDKLFENGRNAKFFKFYKDESMLILINEDNSKEHIRIDDPTELENYYKILWVVKKY